MEGSPSEEQIKPKRAPPKRKQQTEQGIKETPKEDIEEMKEPEQTKEENIRITKMVKCDKCQKI
jgi:hypothetical protein